LEDLSVEDITSPHANINRKLYSIGIRQLIDFITYKAENAGKYVVKVNPAYTTQTCSQCRNRQKLSLKDRVYECDCGYTENRDANAASNILRLGLESLACASA
jgi:putative transposase